jgi:hypothetical protein
MRNVVEIPTDVKKALMVVWTNENKVTAYPVHGDVEVYEMASMTFGCFVRAIKIMEKLMEDDEFTKEVGINPITMMREEFKTKSLEKVLADWNFASGMMCAEKEQQSKK